MAPLIEYPAVSRKNRYVLAGALVLSMAAGCVIHPPRSAAPSQEQEKILTTDLLLGKEEKTAVASAAIHAWKNAALLNDTLWMEGLEQRFGMALSRLALIALVEDREEVLENWSTEERRRLGRRMGLDLGSPCLREIQEWRIALLDESYDRAFDLACAWPESNAAEVWIKNRAKVKSLYNLGRFMEAADLLNQARSRSNPQAFQVRDQLLRIECLRRAGRFDEGRGEWTKAADQILTLRDDGASSLLLRQGFTLENLSNEPLDKGRLVALAERAESYGDIVRSLKVYNDIWGDPRLPRSAEQMALQNEVYRRAGLGELRIIAGGLGEGNHSPRVRRWMDTILAEPDSMGRRMCECELRRFEGAMYLRRHHLAQALESLTKAAELAEMTGRAELIARGRGDLCVIQAQCGKIEEALENCLIAGRAAEASGDAALLYETERNRLVLLSGMGREPAESELITLAAQGKRLGRLSPGVLN